MGEEHFQGPYTSKKQHDSLLLQHAKTMRHIKSFNRLSATRHAQRQEEVKWNKTGYGKGAATRNMTRYLYPLWNSSPPHRHMRLTGYKGESMKSIYMVKCYSLCFSLASCHTHAKNREKGSSSLNANSQKLSDTIHVARYIWEEIFFICPVRNPSLSLLCCNMCIKLSHLFVWLIQKKKEIAGTWSN